MLYWTAEPCSRLVQTLPPNDIASARWQHLYPGYFGFAFVGGSVVHLLFMVNTVHLQMIAVRFYFSITTFFGMTLSFVQLYTDIYRVVKKKLLMFNFFSSIFSLVNSS